MYDGWRRVSKAEPCPVCGKPDWCKVSDDGAVALCGRVEPGSFAKADGNGGFLHRLIDRPRPDYGGNGQAPRSSAKPPTGKVYPDAQAAIDAAGAMVGGRFVAGWTYRNRDGGEAFRVIRFALADGDKRYRPIRLAKDGWRIGDPPGPLPLYRLPDLPAAGTIFVCEGEKAADAAAGLGLAATASAHGSGAAEKSDWSPLAGRDVAILPDNDEPGRKYAQDVARRLVAIDPPAKVKIVELPGLPPKGDVVEYVEARPGQAPDAIRAEIEALAAKAPELELNDLIGGPVMTCLADVQARDIAWLWPGRIPLGRITLLVGRPGEGKSFLTTDMAARVTTGTPWPDGADCPAGSVILVSAEDDPADTIKPRLDAHRADCRKVHLLAGVRRIDSEGTPQERMFTLADLPALESALKAHPDCKLIVIDPIGSFLGGDTDAHRDNEVRGVLAPVAKLAEKYGPAVLVVAHRRKGGGTFADDLAIGSRAFTGIARAVWHLSRDSENKSRRLLLPGKNNVAPEGDGLAFAIAGDPPTIQWEREPVAMSADDALAQENGGGGDDERRPGPEPEARSQAAEWLRDLLRDGAMESAKIRGEAVDAGYSWRTVHRAKDELGIKPYREQFAGAWLWKLPPDPTCQDLSCHVPKEQENLASWHDSEIPRKNGPLPVPQSLPCQDAELGTIGSNAPDDGPPIDLDYARAMCAEADERAAENGRPQPEIDRKRGGL